MSHDFPYPSTANHQRPGLLYAPATVWRVYQETPPPWEELSSTHLMEKLTRLHPPGHHQTRPLAFSHCHLRNLRLIHEKHGAECAERVLKVIVSRVHHVLQDDAFLVRISLDQLLIAFGGMDNHEQGAVMAESLRVVIALPVPIPEASPRIVPSVSIRLQQPGECVEGLLRAVVTDGMRAAGAPRP
jgi:GGDEF domain-containing protein